MEYWETPSKMKMEKDPLVVSTVEVVSSLEDQRVLKIFCKRFTMSMVLCTALFLTLLYWMGAIRLGFSYFLLPFQPLHNIFRNYLSSIMGLFTTLFISWGIAHQVSWSHVPYFGNFGKDWYLTKQRELYTYIFSAVGAALLSKCFLKVLNLEFCSLDFNLESCPTTAGCLQEHVWFMCLCGGFAGWFFSSKYRWDRRYILEFPDPPKSFWESVTNIIYDSVSDSIIGIVPPIWTFYIIYYIFGNPWRTIISFIIGSALNPVSISSLLFSNYKLFALTYLTCLIVMSYMGICTGVTQLCFVQRLKFSLDTDSIDSSNGLTLFQALMSKSYYIRYLAYYDFKLFVGTDDERMLNLLKLSHPGRNPKAWTSALAPLSNLIEETGIKLKGFMTTIEPVQESTKNKNIMRSGSPKAKVLFSTSTPLDSLHHENLEGVSLGVRDLVSTVETKVRFKQDKTAGSILSSPIKKLITAPANIAKNAIEKSKNHLLKFYGVICDWIIRPDVAGQLRNVLVHYKLLIYTTQILTEVAEFSIANDVDGVVATTIGKIIMMHIKFYQVMEDLGNRLKPINTYEEVRHWEFQILLNLLEEYKKSLVYFYINYAAYYEILQIPIHISKTWNRICNSELGCDKILIRSNPMDGNTLFPDVTE